MPGVKGAPRNCRTCGFKHPPPTGLKCDFNPANLSLQAQTKLEKVTGAVGQGDTGSESEGEGELQQLSGCLEQQQQQLNGMSNEFAAMRTTVTDLQQGVQQILDIVKEGPSTSTPLLGALGCPPPMFGGVRPPSGPLPYSDSEGEDSDSDQDQLVQRKRKKKPFDLKRHLPKDVKKPSSIQQLVGALSRLQTVHLMRKPYWTPYCGNIQLHVQFLCDRAVMGLYTMDQLLRYDAGVRERANCYDAQAFVYGDEEMMSTHLVALQAGGGSTPTQSVVGAQGGGSSQKKKKPKSPAFVADPDTPCWRYNGTFCKAGAKCDRPHVCYHCWDPSHKMKACPNVKRSPAGKSSA